MADRLAALEAVAQAAKEAMECRGEFDPRAEHFTTYDPPCELCRGVLQAALAQLATTTQRVTDG